MGWLQCLLVLVVNWEHYYIMIWEFRLCHQQRNEGYVPISNTSKSDGTLNKSRRWAPISHPPYENINTHPGMQCRDTCFVAMLHQLLMIPPAFLQRINIWINKVSWPGGVFGKYPVGLGIEVTLLKITHFKDNDARLSQTGASRGRIGCCEPCVLKNARKSEFPLFYPLINELCPSHTCFYIPSAW